MYIYNVFDAIESAIDAYDGKLSDYYFINQCMRIICELYGMVLLGIMDYFLVLLVLRFDAEEQPWRTLGHDPYGFIWSKYTQVYDVGSIEDFGTQQAGNNGTIHGLDLLNGTTPGQEPNYRLVLRRYGKGCCGGILGQYDGWKIFGFFLHYAIHDFRALASTRFALRERGIEDSETALEHCIIWALSLVPTFFSGQSYYDNPVQSIVWLILLECIIQAFAVLARSRLEEEEEDEW
ncbi:hypothetical protein CFIO01_12965 [Colletotrichum fioriniae PJ7]|uniref:Uncharacterized protein n=1 Tax=Colletotrichum fioriniae PJ7 TaxID=1445577 RepID=A0A010S6Z9_9PEZI|nr:hypothetical protein CFIO01_12965 [Colletotrichum fioriniae PJ7]